MTTHGFVQSLDLTKMMLSADVLGAAGGEKIECPSQHHFPCLNTCLNTSFLVSTPADQHLFPRLNTWLLNAESCLNVEPQALVGLLVGIARLHPRLRLALGAAGPR